MRTILALCAAAESLLTWIFGLQWGGEKKMCFPPQRILRDDDTVQRDDQEVAP
jgi:hypothetical protein